MLLQTISRITRMTRTALVKRVNGAIAKNFQLISKGKGEERLGGRIHPRKIET